MLRVLFILLLCCDVMNAEVRTVWQTLHDYNTIIEPSHPGRQDRHVMNPFLSYTNIGTDFGFVGPAEAALGWQRGSIGTTLSANSDEWAGMWHSLSRLARMPESTMNFNACYPKPITADFQPKVTGLRALVRGKGRFKIDLVGAQNQLLWSATRIIDSSDFAEQLYDLPAAGLDSVKILTWIAEPGSNLDVDRIDFRMHTPDIGFDQWVFLTSYAKALTCWSASTGLVRDRAHIDDGSFDSISSTGLFCLATAAAAGEGIVSHDFATAVISKACQAVSTLRGPYQLLPHFVRLDDNGTLQRHKSTEYSTIDTSIFYLSLMLGCRMLGQDDMLAQLVQDVRMIRFAPLISDEGYLSHGVMADEKTIIPYQWKDWGGETALVLVMMRIADPQSVAMMDKTGHVNQGTGFIVEIQSLLLPDFDNEALDAVSGVNWRKVRATMLQAQREYFTKRYPDNPLVKNGFYGLSAGEQRYGKGYTVGGVDLEDQMLLHPHYMLMSAAGDPEPLKVREILKLMEKQNILTPWGMVENVWLGNGETLPMIGSLNACFEALGSYHFECKASKRTDSIYEAARAIPELNTAMKVFYP